MTDCCASVVFAIFKEIGILAAFAVPCIAYSDLLAI